jgi:hypothetical protein
MKIIKQSHEILHVTPNILFQDDGAFEMAKVIENKGRVVEFQKKKK